MLRYGAIAERLQELLGTKVDLLGLPARKARIGARIERDQVHVFLSGSASGSSISSRTETAFACGPGPGLSMTLPKAPSSRSSRCLPFWQRTLLRPRPALADVRVSRLRRRPPERCWKAAREG